MAKFYLNLEDRERCAFAINEDIWFEQNQSLLCRMANTKVGRDLLCIDQSLPPVVLFRKNCVHCLIGINKGIATMQADFRIGAKWANVIRYRWKEFCSMKKYFELKQWQDVGRTPYILGDRVCALTLTKYPDPDVEIATVDGTVSRGLANPGESFSSLMSGAGNGKNDNGASDYFIFFACANASNNFRYNHKTIALFDTSSLTASASVSSASASFNGDTTDNGDSIGGFAIGLVSSNPASNTSLANSDYSNVGTTRYANDIAYSSWSTSSYNTYSMNATGISNISKTSITKLGLGANYFIDNSAPTWVNNLTSRVWGKFAETTGTSTDPKLEVTYTTLISNLLLLNVG